MIFRQYAGSPRLPITFLSALSPSPRHTKDAHLTCRLYNNAGSDIASKTPY